MKVQFKQWSCIAHGRYYDDKSKAIQLLSTDGQEAIAVATVSLEHMGVIPEDGNVFIKGWSENEGMEQAMIDAGIIEPDRIRTLHSGFVKVGEYALTDNGKGLFK